MDRLRDVLGWKTGYLARVLELHAGIEGALARRFVQIAGAELIESYLWQKSEIEGRELADPSISRDLLSGACAGRIADELGMSREHVWEALRAFVPHVLQLAHAGPRANAAPPSMSAGIRRARPMTSRAPALLHPMD